MCALWMQALLSTTERVVQEIDSVEYGLTDIQEYYANTGAIQQPFFYCVYASFQMYASAGCYADAKVITSVSCRFGP